MSNEIDERRVTTAQTRYDNARRIRDAFWVEHVEVLEQYHELCERTNMALKKFEQACRETQLGAGGVTVRIANKPVFNLNYLETRFASQPDILDELVVISKKVQPKVFDRLANEGVLNKEDINKAVERMEHKVSLYGVPKPTVLQ